MVKTKEPITTCFKISYEKQCQCEEASTVEAIAIREQIRGWLGAKVG